MTHWRAAHERGTHNMFTGYRPPAIQYPFFRSVVRMEFGPRNQSRVRVHPEPAERLCRTGYLGSAFGPFSSGSDPATKGFTVRDLTLPAA